MKISNRMNKLWKWIKGNHNTLMGIVTLIITIVYGFWGVNLSNRQIELSETQIELSKKQDSTSLDLIHFSKLLKKTDSVIILSKDQLLVNREVQERANINYLNSEIGYMNRLKDKLYQIQKEFLEYIGSNSSDVRMPPTVDSLKDLNKRFVRLKNLLVSEMNNPYVNSNDTQMNYVVSHI